MKIAFISDSYLPNVGGLELVLHEIAKRFLRHDHIVNILVPTRQKTSPQGEVIDGIPVWALATDSMLNHSSAIPSPLRFGLRGALRSIKLAMYLRKLRADVVHVHYLSETALYAAIACGFLHIPFVATAHGSDLTCLSPKCMYKWKIVKFVLRRAAAVTAVSPSLIDIARKIEPSISSKSQVISNGVDVALFDQYNEYPPLVDYPYVLAVGNLKFVKGHDILLRSFPHITKRYTEHRLIIAGEGSERNKLEALANETGIKDRVIFWGRASRLEVARLLHMCDFLIMPSRNEGFGVAILEAYACRKPVVANRVGGLVGLVDNGKTGLLVEAEHELALADAIASLLDDPQIRANMGQAGRQLTEGYNWETIVDQYIKVIENVKSC